MEIRTKSNRPFKTEAAAKKAIFGKAGFMVAESDGGWIGKSDGSPGFDVQLDVQCPGCGQCYHETTEQYNPDIDANPAMLSLKEPYKSWGWTGMPNDPSMGYGCLECPDCGTALSPSGTLRIKNA